MGISVSNELQAFDKEIVDSLFSSVSYVAEERPGWLFHCIDTSNGGTGQSDTAWVSLYFNHRHEAVVSSLSSMCRLTCSGKN